jgi:hypothetical protein
MMRYVLGYVLGFVCLAALCLADVSHAEVPGPDDAVITLNDFCANNEHASGSHCKTIITRAQLESLAAALQPGMSPELRGKVATSYARLLRMAAVAEKRGLDKTPAFAQEMAYARLQLLSQDLGRVLRQEADQVSASDIRDYYQKNSISFLQATMARIFIPGTAKGTSKTDMAQVAAAMRVRAVKGEDPDMLQAAAYTAAGIPGTSPKTTLKNLRRSSLPPSHEIALDLAPGQVSEVISDPDGGHFIYKMVHRETLTLEEASPEIRKTLADERYEVVLKGFSGGTTLNDAYFASATVVHPRHHVRTTD